MKVYEELKKPFLDRYNELKDEFIVKTKPIVKRWTPIIKDIEVSGNKKKNEREGKVLIFFLIFRISL